MQSQVHWTYTSKEEDYCYFLAKYRLEIGWDELSDSKGKRLLQNASVFLD